MLLLLGVLLLIPANLAQNLCNPTEYSDKIKNILLKQSEYIIYEGKLIFLFNSTAFGANPSSIYGVFNFGDNVNITSSNSASNTYFLRSSNAIIFPGCTSPQSIYFSLVSYIYNRYNYIQNGTFYDKEILFASLGASLNNLVWNTSNGINHNYNSLTTYIQTGDKQTFNDINNLLIQNGISQSQINLQSLPNQYIHFLPYKYNNDNINEYNQTYDTGNVLYRIAIPTNNTKYQKYIHQNQSIYMLQPKNILNGTLPRMQFEPVTRNTYSSQNVNETAVYNDTLNAYKLDLIDYLKLNYNMNYIKQYTFMNTANGERSDYGYSCIDNNVDCAGDNRDADYWHIDQYIKLNNNSFYMFLGIIHNNLYPQQTLYSNIVIYEHVSDTPGPAINNFQYNGSGLILPVNSSNVNNKKDLENIFVVQFSRDYSCIKDLPGFCLSEKELSPNTVTRITARNYLNPTTKTRPDAKQIIPNILLQFQLS